MVGAFSRYGWSHPGPIWFLVLAPFELLGGYTGMVIGSILVVGIIMSVTVDVVWTRLGYWPVAVILVTLSLVVAGVKAFGVVVPWNPHLAWPLFALFLVVLLLAVRDLRPLILAVLVTGWVSAGRSSRLEAWYR